MNFAACLIPSLTPCRHFRAGGACNANDSWPNFLLALTLISEYKFKMRLNLKMKESQLGGISLSFFFFFFGYPKF